MPSQDYTFRIRFRRSPTDTVNIEEAIWELPNTDPVVTLQSTDPNVPLKDSEMWVMRSSSYSTAEEADSAANHYLRIAKVALCALRIGADFGERSAKSVVYPAGLAHFENKTGKPSLNDVHGISVFETRPDIQFVSFSAEPLRGVSHSRFEAAFAECLASTYTNDRREDTCRQLFSASFFQANVDARFMLLVMALEALIVPSLRSNASQAMIDKLMDNLNGSKLTDAEKESLANALGSLKRESISRAGRTLVRDRVGERRYGEMDASKFFTTCYTLRSRLAHGDAPLPSRKEVNAVVAQLENLVADVVCPELRTRLSNV